MKKLFSLVLVLCMLMSAAAFAEQRAVLQDEQPPKIVASVNEAGEVVVAKVCDKDGNVLMEIKDAATVEITDAHFRSDVENAEIAQRLTLSYEDVMDEVHHSDVDCRMHEHAVKVDINEILTSIQHEMNAHDLIMFELYDVMFNSEVADLLAQDPENYVEVTFEVNENQWQPLIVMHSVDGASWHVIGSEQAGEKQFTVKLYEAAGVVALLVDGREVMGIGEEIISSGEYVPGTPDSEYVEIPNFTPSVSGKSAPRIVRVEGTDGEWYVSYIRNIAGDVEIPVPDRNYVIVTAVSERDYTADIQTHEHLEWAYDSIMAAETVGDLYTEHDMSAVVADEEHATIAGLLDETLVQMGLDLTHEQLVVKDLFEVTAYDDYVHYLYDPEYYMEVTFDTDLDPEKPVVVIHSADSVHWHVHPMDEFVVNADGSVTLKMYDMGAVAFLVEAEETVNAETAVQSPN